MTAWLAEQVSELGPKLRRRIRSSASAAACVPIYVRSQIFVPPLLLFRSGADRSEQLPHLLVPQLLLHEVEYLDAAAAARVELPIPSPSLLTSRLITSDLLAFGAKLSDTRAKL